MRRVAAAGHATARAGGARVPRPKASRLRAPRRQAWRQAAALAAPARRRRGPALLPAREGERAGAASPEPQPRPSP